MLGIRTVRAVHAGFDGDKHARIHRRLNPVGEMDEAVKLVLRPHGVELMPDGRFCLGEYVEAEDRAFPVELLIGVAEGRCL